MAKNIDPKGEATKKILKRIGFLLFVPGAILTVIGLVDFFGAMMGNGFPQSFFLCFIGMPLMGIGGFCLKFAYMGNVARYTAGQAAPIVKDSVNYLLDGTRDEINETIKVFKGEKPSVKCPKCDKQNVSNAIFCDQCGTKLGLACRFCNTENDSNAKYCKKCGKEIC